MTRVNLLLPLFETALKTNNSEVVSEIIKQKYGLSPSDVFWLPSLGEKDGREEFYECVVRIPNLSLNFDQVVDSLERRKSIEQTLKRIKVDIFNAVKKYDELLSERRNGALTFEKGKDFAVGLGQDSQVSLKIEQKSKNNSLKERQGDYSQSQLMNAISQLTRENLKLKDAVIYYEAQFQFLMKTNDPTKKEAK